MQTCLPVPGTNYSIDEMLQQADYSKKNADFSIEHTLQHRAHGATRAAEVGRASEASTMIL